MNSVRLDKWLWAVRLYKTRSQATEACRSGHVKIEGQSVKPAREVRVGEIVTARLDRLTRTVRVLALLERRVGGVESQQYAEDLTPAAEYEAAREAATQARLVRPSGLGRPTKRDRRRLAALSEESELG